MTSPALETDYMETIDGLVSHFQENLPVFETFLKQLRSVVWAAAGSVDTRLSYMFLCPSVLLEVDGAQIAQG